MDMGGSSEAGRSGGASSAADFEVFLSFRGPDTRQGFTDCLYHALRDANIRVFFDEEELHVGKEIADELPAAIEKSRIYIPIFSKGYASSAWCLRELARMVECRKSKPSEKEIMPIFYDVGSDDVKLKSQLYVGALDEHEKKYDRQTRAEWEDALKSVAKIKGWELKKQGYGEFIKSVIGEILMKLKTKDKYVTEHLVGMDDRVETIVKLLDVNSGGMRFVLIHGMGGIGKTTLAKVVFNKLNSLFSHCCFLGNVRESSSPSSGLVNLQKQLLFDTLGSAFRDKINDVDDGINMIARRLCNRKLFIVLDDVDDEEQLEKLGIKCVSFGPGSRVILTTRNRSIIKANQTLEYEATMLDSIQSLKLFSRHAFGRNSPLDDYVGLSRQVVSTTGGLPLALQVIGSLLGRQNKAYWKDVLDKLKEVPHEKVRDKLKISYNSLTHEQKQIFLDIACLFADEDKTNAFYMWKDCRFFPDHSISALVCMSLIKITDDNKFWMHDQLRDLGRQIVRGYETPMDPSKQSRLWDHETADDFIRTEEKKEAIEAVCLDEGTYTGEEFSRLPNIRFLKLNWRAALDGDFESQLKTLRYLTWRADRWDEGCTEELFSAINFHPSNLVVLDLSNNCCIKEDWAGWSQIKVAEKLKVLDLSFCYDMTRTPDFSHYLSLERLILEGCDGLVEVDGSLEKLKCLTYFNARGCECLGELPEGIGGLEKLEYLDLGGCFKLRKLPESFARVTSLIELDLSGTAITRLPDSIGNQKRLSILKLQGTKINELPDSIGDLSRLKVIKISDSDMRELPQSIVALKELEELHANRCEYLEWEIPEGICELSLLRVLLLKFTPIRNVPVTIKLLPHLEKLKLDKCNGLELLPELPTSLTSLSFGSSSLRQVVDLSSLTKLSDLTYCGHNENHCPLFIQGGPCGQSLTFLPPSLSTLSLNAHVSKTRLSFRGNFKKLTHLQICSCLWKEVQLDGLEQLIEFKVYWAKLLEGFAGLSSLKRLKLLRLDDCPNLTAIQGLGSVESLERLDIVKCPKIESLDDLSDLKKLEQLNIHECQELVAVEGLDELKRLKLLRLTNCPKLTAIQGLGSVESLEQLDIISCPEIESLDDLSDLKKLERLKIHMCQELVAVKGLDTLETLKQLDFFFCGSLRSFPNVFNSKVPGECFLCVHGCPNLEVDWFRGRVSQYGEWRRKQQQEEEERRRKEEEEQRRKEEEWRRKEEEDEDEGLLALSLSFSPERGRKRRRHQEEKEDDKEKEADAKKKEEEEDDLRLSLSFPPERRRHEVEKEDDTFNEYEEQRRKEEEEEERRRKEEEWRKKAEEWRRKEEEEEEEDEDLLDLSLSFPPERGRKRRRHQEEIRRRRPSSFLVLSS